MIYRDSRVDFARCLHCIDGPKPNRSLILTYGFAMWDNGYEFVDLAPSPALQQGIDDIMCASVLSYESLTVLEEMMAAGERSALRICSSDREPLPLGLLQLTRLVSLHAASSQGPEGAQEFHQTLNNATRRADSAVSTPLTAVQFAALLSSLADPLSEHNEAAALDLVDEMLADAFGAVSSALDVKAWLDSLQLGGLPADDGNGEVGNSEDEDDTLEGDAAEFEQLAAAARERDSIRVGENEYCVTPLGCQVAWTESQLGTLMVAMDTLRLLMGSHIDAHSSDDGSTVDDEPDSEDQENNADGEAGGIA